MRSVAIIGAGPFGLAAARHSLAANHVVMVFEQSDQLGGTWVYRENSENGDCSTTRSSAMYEGLM